MRFLELALSYRVASGEMRFLELALSYRVASGEMRDAFLRASVELLSGQRRDAFLRASVELSSSQRRDAFLRAQLYGLGYPRQPSPRATLAEVTFSLFLSKIQPAVYIRIANSSRGGETTRVGELSHLGR